jgi:hypothetical protein
MIAAIAALANSSDYPQVALSVLMGNFFFLRPPGAQPAEQFVSNEAI